MSPAAGSERPQNQKLIDVSLDHNLEQVVDKPTREDKILDLLFTNNKSSPQKIEIFPVLENLITKLFLQKLIPSLAVFQNQNVTSFFIEKQTGMALDQT